MEGAQRLPPPVGIYITALRGHGWGDYPKLQGCQQQGRLCPCPGWAQLCGWRFPAGAGTLMFPQPPQAGGTPWRREGGPAAAQTEWSHVAAAVLGAEVPRSPGAAGERTRGH